MRASDVDAMLLRHLPGGALVDARALDLYQRAVVHRSYTCRGDAKRERANATCPAGTLPLQPTSYERLEFLGDAVLGLVTAAYLFERYPGEDEGFMTRMRTKLVNGRMLAELCRRHTPLPLFIASEPTSADGTSSSADDPRVLEDVLEAFLGALYIDRGFDAARRWLVGFLEENVDFAELVATQDNAKSVLNRHYSQHHGFIPEVQELADGVVRLVTPSGAVIATGSGATRRDAENVAVRKALDLIAKRDRT